MSDRSTTTRLSLDVWAPSNYISNNAKNWEPLVLMHSTVFRGRLTQFIMIHVHSNLYRAEGQVCNIIVLVYKLVSLSLSHTHTYTHARTPSQ
jgi:hypothetical protein